MPGGDLEYLVLSSLWDREPATAREIHEAVGAPEGLAYTTIATVLDRLHTKGLVKRRRSGKRYIYQSNVERVKIEKRRAREAVGEILGEDPAPAIAALVEAVEAIDPSLLDDLAREVARRRRSRRGS